MAGPPLQGAGVRHRPTVVWAAVASFVAVTGIAAALSVEHLRDQTQVAASARLGRAANGAEAVVNRTMLGMDLLLADVGRELADLPAQVNPGLVEERLRVPVRRSVWLRDVLLLADDGRVLAAAGEHAGRRGEVLPPAFVRTVLARPVPELVVSPPVVNSALADRSLYFARAVDLADGRRALLVGEMALAFFETLLSQVGAVQGLTVTFERDDGELLASAPRDESRLGKRLPPRPATQDVTQAPGRLSGAPAFVASRPSVYRSTAVAVSLSHDTAFAVWRRERLAIGVAALLFSLFAVAAGAATHWQLARLARARLDAAAAKASLDRALEAMDDGFLLCDPSGRVAMWNRRYVEMFPWVADVLAPGVPFERIVDSAAQAVTDGRDAAQRAAWRERRLSLHRRGSGIHEQELPDGRVIHTVERRTPDGGVVSVFRDVTSRERELARAKSLADAADVAKAQFLATMTDEMRTPLNGVLGMNRLLQGTRLDAQQAAYAKAVEASARGLLSLVDDMLELAKLEAGRSELASVDFSPQRLLHEVAAAMAPVAEAKGLAFTTHTDGSLPPALRGDLRRLRQVLGHLLGNAVKFTERGSVTTEMRCRALPDGRFELLVSLRDTGVGMAPEVLPTLFERFTQVDSGPARRHGGSGVGLALSREIVDRMGGRIAVESALGAGSTFHLTLPFDLGDAASLDGETVSGALEPATQRAQVLVAEDNEVNQLLVCELLERLGHACDVVTDGAQALAQVQARRYDLVLMDIRMPEVDGIEATRRIRALPGPAGRVPIVALTANASAEDRAQYLAAGMDDLVAKPVQPQQLARAIARALQTATKAA